MLVDTHCHLNFKAFKKNLDQVLWQASQLGVERIIVPGTDRKSSQKAVNLACHFINVYAAVGIHPHHSNIQYQKTKIRNELKKLAKNNKVVAIGECGLDYYCYSKTKYCNYKIDDKFKKKQKELFILQLSIASELKLPVIIHNRMAAKDIISIFNDFSSEFFNLKGVFHCFEGDEKFLSWVLKKGFYVAFNGMVTYENSLKKIIKKTPLKRILLETDGPFLLPEPLKSKKLFPNKPENVKIIAEEIAKIKGDSFLNVAKRTTLNAKKLFKIN